MEDTLFIYTELSDAECLHGVSMVESCDVCGRDISVYAKRYLIRSGTGDVIDTNPDVRKEQVRKESEENPIRMRTKLTRLQG